VSVAKLPGRVALTVRIAEALHADSSMRSVRWCDLGPLEKKFRMEQAAVAMKTIESWAKEMREPWVNLMNNNWLGEKEKNNEV